jgi:hypothetical protein
MSRLYSFVAVALLVGLGLGLIYLYSVGRINAVSAVGIVLGLGTLMILGTVLADAVGQERLGLRRRIPDTRP